jgi:(1->4)-alpha-D-glucan 1-alpha-D-glucosylmutase
LQFNRAFGFAQAHELVAYLYELGISDVYASPILKARPGSPHGYDVVDYASLNPELGSEEDFRALARCLQRRDMGILMDMVPNHMGIADPSNRWWADVLENGPTSSYARYFDIDWDPPKAELAGKVLLPILGDQFGNVLESGRIQIRFVDGLFLAQVYDIHLPLAPKSWNRILEPVRNSLPHASPELESIMFVLRNFPETAADRAREKEFVRRRLLALTDIHPAIQEWLVKLNGVRGDPRSFDGLEQVLAEQFYRLSYWRVAADEINYRPFFDINELAAIRVEDPDVFREVHALPFRLLQEGLIHGLRIDHPDGLLDPEAYFQSLVPCYVVAEKILAEDERLRPWRVYGTTGYEFAAMVNGLFIDRRHRRAFRRLYERFTGERRSFEDIAYESKKLILRKFFWSELHGLAKKLDRISEQHRSSRDFTQNSLHDALTEIIACFPVYRTYIRSTVSPEDRAVLELAVRQAKRRNPATPGSIFDFVLSALLTPGEWVGRVQQLTAPVTAKGIEDTAFYRYVPLASLNEVGGSPDRFGTPVKRFHRRCQERRSSWPHGLSASSTHDTKRSEDVRARLNVLSEIPVEWERAIRRWRAMNASDIDPAEEYLLYQTLVGTWERVDDAYVSRIESYMVKALNEAKVHTSWLNPDEEHLRGMREFVRRILGSPAFVEDMSAFVASISRAGRLNSLAQTLLKIAAPGVPDFYQGTELWDSSLVDPDNRRSVDFARRQEMLASIRGGIPSDVEAPEMKLFLIHRALQFRRAHRELFAEGDHVPLEAGRRAIAFARRFGGEAAVAAVGRFFLSPERWGEIDLPEGRYSDIFTGREFAGRVSLSELFSVIPAVLLEKR